MISDAYSIVLTTPRIYIPNNPNIFEIVNDVIHNNLCNIDYFGLLLDNDVDYIDDAMADKIALTSYFTIHFRLDNQIELESYTQDDEMIGLLLDVIINNEITEIRSDDKDVIIYVNV